MNRRRFLAGVAASSTLLAGCTTALGIGGNPDFDVGMRASAFVPQTFTTTVGDTVEWYNNNDRPHTVTAYGASLPEGAEFFASGGFESTAAARKGYNDGFEGAIDPGRSYEHTFEVPGEYEYFCVPHEAAGMVGTIVVEE